MQKTVYKGKSGDYDKIRIIEVERKTAGYILAKDVVGQAVELQTHIGGAVSKSTAFAFTLDLCIPGETLFVVMGKLPENSGFEPLGFYTTEREARKSIAYRGFIEKK